MTFRGLDRHAIEAVVRTKIANTKPHDFHNRGQIYVAAAAAIMKLEDIYRSDRVFAIQMLDRAVLEFRQSELARLNRPEPPTQRMIEQSRRDRVISIKCYECLTTISDPAVTLIAASQAVIALNKQVTSATAAS